MAAVDRLCESVEATCARLEPLLTGVEAALLLFAAESQLGLRLSAQPPREETAFSAARRLLIGRLAAMLRRARGSEEQSRRPPGIDERLIDATLAFVHNRFAPELTSILDRLRAVV